MHQDQQQDGDKQEGRSENIWGWRFSLFGLALILVMSAVMFARHKMLDKPFDGWSPPQEQADSLKTDTTTTFN